MHRKQIAARVGNPAREASNVLVCREGVVGEKGWSRMVRGGEGKGREKTGWGEGGKGRRGVSDCVGVRAFFWVVAGRSGREAEEGRWGKWKLIAQIALSHWSNMSS